MKLQTKTEELIVLESALFRTTSTIIIGKEYLLLVDPNWLPGEVEYIYELVQPYLTARKPYLLFTHSDYDHIIGAARFADFTCIASQNFVQHPDKASILQQINDFDDQYYIQRSYPIEYPEIDMVIDGDPQELKIGEDEYLFFQAAGHNKDGLLTFNKSRGILIMGDYLSNEEFPFVYESFSLYQKVLDQIAILMNTEVIHTYISGHGDISTHLTEMQSRLETARLYLKELEAAVRENTNFNLDKWLNQYNFPKIHSQFHSANLKLMQKEVGKR